jgi:hypothetical protein
MQAEHANGSVRFTDRGHAFDLQARLAEIEQQAELQAGSLEIMGALHVTNHSHVLDQQVGEVLADDYVIAVHLDATLLHNCAACVTQFTCQPITAPDRSFSLSISACISVNLLTSALMPSFIMLPIFVLCWKDSAQQDDSARSRHHYTIADERLSLPVL